MPYHPLEPVPGHSRTWASAAAQAPGSAVRHSDALLHQSLRLAAVVISKAWTGRRKGRPEPSKSRKRCRCQGKKTLAAATPSNSGADAPKSLAVLPPAWTMCRSRGSSVSKAPCGWIDPGAWIGSRSQLVRSTAPKSIVWSFIAFAWLRCFLTHRPMTETPIVGPALL